MEHQIACFEVPMFPKSEAVDRQCQEFHEAESVQGLTKEVQVPWFN